jgi:hypothetical protein
MAPNIQLRTPKTPNENSYKLHIWDVSLECLIIHITMVGATIIPKETNIGQNNPMQR